MEACSDMLAKCAGKLNGIAVRLAGDHCARTYKGQVENGAAQAAAHRAAIAALLGEGHVSKEAAHCLCVIVLLCRCLVVHMCAIEWKIEKCAQINE